jgi:hypothetical protein
MVSERYACAGPVIGENGAVRRSAVHPRWCAVAARTFSFQLM